MSMLLQMKHLEKKGDKEGAISIAEQKAWSGALHKAEGKKVSLTYCGNLHTSEGG